MNMLIQNLCSTTLGRGLARRDKAAVALVLCGAALIAAAACGPKEPAAPGAASPPSEATETQAASAEQQTPDTGSEATAAAPDGGTSAAAPATGSGQPAFRDMTHEQRLEFMGDVVLPRMRKLFEDQAASEHAQASKATPPKGAQAKAEAKFGCATCHGKNMKEVKYKMPNKLVALPAADPYKGGLELDEGMTHFMAEKVVPTMAELLGEKPYNPETHSGFGCFNCHQKE